MNPLRIFLLAALVLVVFGSTEVEADQEPIWESFTTGEVYSMSTSSDGSYIVVGTWESKPGSNASGYYPQIHFFEKDNSTPLWSKTTKGMVNDVDISANGEYIAVVTGADNYDDGVSAEGGHIYFFGKNSSTPILDYTVEDNVFIRAVTISEEGEYLAATGGSHLYFFNRDSPAPLWNFTSDDEFSNVEMSADGNYIVAGNRNNTMYLFTKDNNTPLRNYVLGECSGICRLFASISDNGEYIAAGSTNGDWEQGHSPAISLFSKNNNTPLWVREVEGRELNDLAISSNGKYIGAGFSINGGTTGIKQTGKFYLLDSTGEEVWSYSTNKQAVTSIALSAEGESVVIGVIDFGIHYFSNTSSIPIWTYTIGGGPVPVYISASGDYIIAGLGDVGYGGGVALLSKNYTENNTESANTDETESVNTDEELFLPSLPLVTSLISIGLLAIFRRK